MHFVGKIWHNRQCRIIFKVATLGVIYFFYTVLQNVDKSTVYSNYFQIGDNNNDVKWSYIVDTPKCKIINISEWDKSVIPFYHPPEHGDPIWPFDCYKRSVRHWTYVENSNLIINETALRETGYSPESINCCYKAILRVEQTYENFDDKADARIKFTKKCFRMQETTKMEHEFVRVICSSKYFPVPNGVLYKQFHPIPLKKAISPEKIEHWSQKEGKRPPNIIILGIDTMSRLNFRRSMPKTKAILEKAGTVEMFGYTKVGENTWPNLAVLLSGYEGNALLKICRENITDTRHDFCPYVWKDFAKAQYATTIIEDRIDICTFNFFNMGFIKKPVDFFFRPFMLGVYEHEPYHQHLKRVPKVNAMDCIGHKTTDQVILEYNQGLTNLSIPLFSFSWNTNLAHEDQTAPRNVDLLYANFFQGELEKNNTVFIFMSDHGSRHGQLRQTFPGWYEDKLPNMWIHLSYDLRKEYPDWYNNLQENSKRLISTFDVYQTMIHVLETFTDVRVSKNNSGKSLFDTIPDRNCSEAGISHEFCPCAKPQTLSVENPKLQSAANAVLEALNSILPKQCHSLTLDKVTAGAILNTFKSKSSYVVTLLSQPGSILIEAHAEFDSKTGRFEVKSEFMRLNKMTGYTGCIKDSKLEKFCYCA